MMTKDSNQEGLFQDEEFDLVESQRKKIKFTLEVDGDKIVFLSMKSILSHRVPEALVWAFLQRKKTVARLKAALELEGAVADSAYGVLEELEGAFSNWKRRDAARRERQQELDQAKEHERNRKREEASEKRKLSLAKKTGFEEGNIQQPLEGEKPAPAAEPAATPAPDFFKEEDQPF